MSETYTRCATCKADTRLGVEMHCPLCHVTYEKGVQHTCPILDEAVAEGREPSTIDERFSHLRVAFGESVRTERPVTVGARDWSEVKPVGVPCGE